MMKVELFAILKNHAAADTLARQSIQRTFSDIADDVEPFLSFEEVRAFYAEMGKAFGRADVIVAAADEASFLEQKWNMLKALGLKSEICPAVIKAIRETGSVPDASMKAHALMPKDAAVFMTQDGLFSGFAVESGSQTLLYLPMINGRTQELLEKGVRRFFAARADAAAPHDEQKAPQARIEIPDNNIRFVETAKILADQDMTVAFANTQTILYVQNGVRANPLFGDSFIPANVQDNPGSRESVTERMACLADAARKEIGTTLGAAISNIYSVGMDSKELFLHVALADSRSANVRKIVGVPGMSTGDLVSLATDTLYTMLQEYADGAEFPPEDVNVRPLNLFEDGMQPVQENREQKRGTAIKILICVLIAVVLCVLIGFYFREEVAAFFDGFHTEDAAAVEETTVKPFELPVEFAEETTAEEEVSPEVDLALFGTAEDTEKTGIRALSLYETPVAVNYDTDIRDYTPEPAPQTAAATTLPPEPTAAPTTAAPTTAASTAATTAAAKALSSIPQFTLSTNNAAVRAAKEEATTAAAKADGANGESETQSTAAAKSTTKPFISAATTRATTKPTTTTTTTTAAPETTTQSLLASLFDSTKSDGTFTFTVYGYGHGVGMSQYGAIAYSRQGWSYDAILMHYYPGTSLTRETPPASVIYAGQERETRDFLVRVVQKEIGGISKASDMEALKAQAVAAYSFVKAKGYKVTEKEIAYSTLSDSSLSASVRSAVDAVYGQYVSYNGKAALTTFYSSSAGKTTNAQSVWNGSYAYLVSGVESPETVSVSTRSITAAEFRALVDRYNAKNPSNPITLSGNPSQWIEILSHDGARGDVGYVTSIRVGNKIMNGNTFRTAFNEFKADGTPGLKSHCFSLRYE